MSKNPQSAATKAPPAPAPQADAPSSKPGTAAPEAKKKKEKKNRVFHPALKAEMKEVEKKGVKKQKLVPTAKLTEIPADFDAKVHKPLSRHDFTDESVFLEAKANRFEALAKKLREEAAQVRVLGNVAQRNEVKKMLKLQSQLAELEKSLGATKGVDVEAIKKKIAEEVAAKAAKEAAAPKA